MKKLNLLLATTTGVALAMASCPQARADCPSGQTEDPTTGHCIKQQTKCSGKCTFYYDTTTNDFWVNKNSDVSNDEEVLITASIKDFTGKNVNNVTIGEGITGIAKNSNGYFITDGLNGIKTNGTLTLPSTLRNGIKDFFFNNQFSTIDLSSMSNISLEFARDGKDVNIILNQDSNISVSINDAYGSTVPYSVNIICKGNKQKCNSQVRTGVTWPNIHNITKGEISYYTGPSENGNWEIWSDDGVAFYADSTLQKPLGKYDFDGNQTGIYKYDGAGNLTAAIENGVSTYKRTSYTPAEAAAAVKKGNNNKITFTFK